MRVINYSKYYTSKDQSNTALFNFVIIFGFLYQYIGILGFLSYLIAIFGIKYNFRLSDLVLFFAISISIIISFYNSEIYLILSSLRYHFGFFIFYYYFKNNRTNINFTSLFILLFFCTYIEMFLVNSIIDPKMLPNYPEFDYVNRVRNHFSIDWQRVYGFAGNASILATLLIVMYSIVNISVLLIPFIVLILLISSGVGLICIILYLIVHLKNDIIKYLFLITPLIILSAIIFYDNTTFQIYSKFLSVNFNNLIEAKIDTLFMQFNKNLFEIFFGNINSDRIGGDFAWVSLLRNHGLFGLLLVLIFIIDKCNRYNIFPIFLLILTSVHYFTIFSLPGQILTGFLLANRNNKFQKINK